MTAAEEAQIRRHGIKATLERRKEINKNPKTTWSDDSAREAGTERPCQQ